jgi:biopolymer transport protein ExbB/TolQ
MASLYDLTVQLFYQLSNLFFWPVSVALIVLLIWSLIELGRLFANIWQKRSDRRTDLNALGNVLDKGFARVTGSGTQIGGVPVSLALQRFWGQLESRRADLEHTAHFELILEQILRTEEARVTSRLDFSRAMVRLGPMLGLAGTIIPLGPALQALLTGDMGGMVGHLVVGFGAVVCGLMMSGIAYSITLVRERWSRVDLEEMEHLCELLVSARNNNLSREASHARLSA